MQHGRTKKPNLTEASVYKLCSPAQSCAFENHQSELAITRTLCQKTQKKDMTDFFEEQKMANKNTHSVLSSLSFLSLQMPRLFSKLRDTLSYPVFENQNLDDQTGLYQTRSQ